jgi:hypothetical protein
MSPVFNRELIYRQPAPAEVYTIILTALVTESVAVYALNMPHGVAGAAIMHGATIFLVALLIRHHDRENDYRLVSFLLPGATVAGPFGAVLCLLAAITQRLCAPNVQSPSEWIERLLEHDADCESARIYERISLGLDDFRAADNVVPFRDILMSGTTLQKQAAVAKISRYFRPQFAPLLLQAARNSNAAVRVQAATALAKIERDFMTRYISLEAALKKLPDEDPAKLKLAELYDDYAFANLLDDYNQQSLRQKAIHLYEACLSREDKAEWRLSLARLYLRQKQPDAAKRWLQPLVDDEQAPVGTLYWYMEALFQLKEYGPLRALAKSRAATLKTADKTDPAFDEIAALLRTWQGTSTADSEVRDAS